ncbi:C-type lectin domain family 17, member A-like [Macrobrachium nipponense]|uniref:C-type lectin domain family 17, member A-like n=1 Tax=Macrobrachium nipponense TaxID=159736 RepID=UPI0030C7CF0C
MAFVDVAQCPDPYVPIDESRCILLDAFVTRTYREAIDYCKTHGGDLLMMDDCETVGLVYDFIYSGAGMADKHYWLGASDEEEEGTWKFVDNRPVPMGTPFWGPNQPDNGETHNCAILHVIYNQRDLSQSQLIPDPPSCQEHPDSLNNSTNSSNAPHGRTSKFHRSSAPEEVV